jgi:hypothetical protein
LISYLSGKLRSKVDICYCYNPTLLPIPRQFEWQQYTTKSFEKEVFWCMQSHDCASSKVRLAHQLFYALES